MTTFRFTDDGLRAVAPLRPAGESSDRSRAAYAAAVWSCLVEPGDGVAGAFVEARGAVQALQDVCTPDGDAAMLLSQRGAAPGGTAPRATAALRAGFARWRPRLVAEQIAFSLAAAARHGIRLLTHEDPEWPPTLCDLGPHAPLCLWVRGDAACLARGPSVAIVGARAATRYGEHVAMEIAADVAARGVTVVSGAAYGIDGAAHRAALSAGGTTVAMLAGGVDRPYPTGHTDLLATIARTGAVASEAPCAVAPTRWRFLQRNRLIAALSAATVVVEAGGRSGSLNTAGHAADLGRPLGAVPGPVTSASSVGCHRLLREYDARCVTCAGDVLELVGMGAAGAAADDDRTAVVPAAQTRLLDALSVRSWRDVDDIARRSGLSPADVRATLGVMSLAGGVCEDAGRWRRVVTEART